MIELERVCKSFGGVPVLSDVNLSIEKGETAVIIGPSGSGKSVLLQTMNGLIRPDSGRVRVFGRDIFERGADIRALRMRIGMVCQAFNLFSHLTVMENITLAPIRLKGLSRAEAEVRARGLMEIVSILGCANKYPAELSGGQSQRAAIARAMAMEPEIVLFDEPTSALDPTMISEVQASVRAFSKRGLTLAIVTHDMAFAREIATRVIYLDERRVYEQGRPEEIFDWPRGKNTQAFIRRLRTISRVSEGADFDMLGFFSDIEVFSMKYGIDRRGTRNIQLCVEETLGLLGAERGAIKIEIEYSEAEHSAGVTFRYQGPDFNPLEEVKRDYAIDIISGITRRRHYRRDPETGLNEIRYYL